MIDYLRTPHDILAEPAFRVMIWHDADLNAPEGQAAARACLDLFVQAVGDQVAWTILSAPHAPKTPGPLDRAFLDRAHHWLPRSDKTAFESLRMTGAVQEELGAPGTPYLNLHHHPMGFVLEMALPQTLPHDAPHFPDLAQAITQAVLPARPFYGVMGLGFFQPLAIASRVMWMPLGFRRYRAALEIPLAGPEDGLRKAGSAFPYDRHPGVEPGIPDIGWRTILGAEFTDRLTGPAPDHPQVKVGTLGGSEAPATLITIGAAPRWGDINAGEDLPGYAEVAAWLAPIRYPSQIAYRSLFGSKVGDFDGRDRVDAYLSRHLADDFDAQGATP